MKRILSVCQSVLATLEPALRVAVVKTRGERVVTDILPLQRNAVREPDALTPVLRLLAQVASQNQTSDSKGNGQSVVSRPRVHLKAPNYEQLGMRTSDGRFAMVLLVAPSADLDACWATLTAAIAELERVSMLTDEDWG